MLINCPKCGFQQPIDKYCAQCGIDIETYQPAPVPLWKRIFGNLFIQLGLLFIIASIIGTYVYQRGQDNLQQRVTYLRSSVQINSGNLGNSSAEEFNESSSSLDAPESPLQGPSRTPEDNASPTLRETSAAAQSPAVKEAMSSLKLIVHYAEIDSRFLMNLFAASRSTGQFISFNDYSAGILPQANRWLQSPSVKILHKEERTLSNTEKTYQWFIGLSDPRDPSLQIGLNTYIEVADMDQRTLRGNIEVLRSWREETNPGEFSIQKRTFPAIFEIGGSVGFFISGVMPHQSNLLNESELTKIDIFKILLSPAFRSGESDFIIFVEYRRNN